MLSGLGVAPGIVLGNAARIDRAPLPIEHVHLPQSLLESEVSRLYEAVEKAEPPLINSRRPWSPAAPQEST